MVVCKWAFVASLIVFGAGCASAPARPAPTAQVELLDGAPTALDVLLEAGDPALLVFATVWCQSCKREAPALRAWLEARPGARVVYVVSGSARAKVAAYAQAQSLSHPRLDVLVDHAGAVARRYGVRATPTLVLHAKDGVVAPPVHAVDELP